ncbi:hypothetical protein [Arcobacter caeni]|uniref:Cytochrome c oxidase-associated protein CcoH n=1 Tax=Arcobacter caeni TaxID=1912877 RepID=A0A363D0X9_9BACT|nr:hypothetical protein [Arcobacter caeni]PUE64974.1 hypothetical protein B0174_05570 [Arcobacter caeni]
MKRNYWPIFFIGIFTFVFSMIVWTVKSAVSLPVIEDHSFMKKYQDVDKDYNDMMTSNSVFLSKYNLELDVNENKFDLTTSDIKYSQRVLEKYSQHKDVLKVGKNNLKVVVTDKNTNEKKDINIELVVTKTITSDSDLIINNDKFQNNDKIYSSEFELKESNNWIITGSFTVDGTVGYIYIKTNAI